MAGFFIYLVMIQKYKSSNTFARRVGRSLRQAQKDLLTHYLPTVQVQATPDFLQQSVKARNVCLEIGIGNGEYFINNAKANPENTYIACEPYLNGMASALRQAKDSDLKNVLFFPDDVRILLDNISPHYLAEIHIICPDPWPKRRQHARRLITKDFIKQLTSKLKTSGKLIIATDHREYAEWILQSLIDSKSFILSSTDINAYTKLPEGWLHTKYQRIGLSKNHSIYYFALDA